MNISKWWSLFFFFFFFWGIYAGGRRLCKSIPSVTSKCSPKWNVTNVLMLYKYARSRPLSTRSRRLSCAPWDYLAVALLERKTNICLVLCIKSRAAKPIHCAQKWTARLCTEFNKSINNIFLICHILWHFQDGRHWPWEFHMGQKLKHAPISPKIVWNCLSCHKDSKKCIV